MEIDANRVEDLSILYQHRMAAAALAGYRFRQFGKFWDVYDPTGHMVAWATLEGCVDRAWRSLERRCNATR